MPSSFITQRKVGKVMDQLLITPAAHKEEINSFLLSNRQSFLIFVCEAPLNPFFPFFASPGNLSFRLV